MAEILVKQNATLDDTINLIVHRINIDSQSPFIQKLVQTLNVVPGAAFYKALHEFVYRNIKYKLDPTGKERVLRPETTLMQGIGN